MVKIHGKDVGVCKVDTVKTNCIPLLTLANWRFIFIFLTRVSSLNL